MLDVKQQSINLLIGDCITSTCIVRLNVHLPSVSLSTSCTSFLTNHQTSQQRYGIPMAEVVLEILMSWLFFCDLAQSLRI